MSRPNEEITSTILAAFGHVRADGQLGDWQIPGR